MTSDTKGEVTFKTPFRTKNQTVLAEWLDYNGHMNVAYYTLPWGFMGVVDPHIPWKIQFAFV